MMIQDLTTQAHAIWEESFCGEFDGVIDAETDFFDIGGHSFLALRIIAKLNTACGVRIPLRTLFDNPRFGDFVAAVASLGSAEADPSSPDPVDLMPSARRTAAATAAGRH